MDGWKVCLPGCFPKSRFQISAFGRGFVWWDEEEGWTGEETHFGSHTTAHLAHSLSHSRFLIRAAKAVKPTINWWGKIKVDYRGWGLTFRRLTWPVREGGGGSGNEGILGKSWIKLEITACEIQSPRPSSHLSSLLAHGSNDIAIHLKHSIGRRATSSSSRKGGISYLYSSVTFSTVNNNFLAS